MPELPDLERARRLCQQQLVGRRVTHVSIVDEQRLFDQITPREFAEAVHDRRIDNVDRYGKFLWLTLDRRPYPVFHLGHHGTVGLFHGSRPDACSVALYLDDGCQLAIIHRGRFGKVMLRMDPPRQSPITTLGGDALDGLPSTLDLARKFAHRESAIKAALVDERILAGLGGWIADEALFHAGIDPHRPASELSQEEVNQLRLKIRHVINAALQSTGPEETYPDDWLVRHRRDDDRLPAGHRVERDRIAGRSTYWVPAVQH